MRDQSHAIKLGDDVDSAVIVVAYLVRRSQASGYDGELTERQRRWGQSSALHPPTQ